MKNYSNIKHMEVPFTIFLSLCRPEETFLNNLYLCEDNIYLCEANMLFLFCVGKYNSSCSIAGRVMVGINLTSSSLQVSCSHLCYMPFLFECMLLTSVHKHKSSAGVNCNRMTNCGQSTSFPGYGRVLSLDSN